MTQFELYWSIGMTRRWNLHPNWEDIASALEGLVSGSGTVTLDTPGGTRCPGLQCFAERQNYLVMLGEIDNEGEMNVRSLNVPQSVPSKIAILGDCWDSRQVTRDFELVLTVYREFFESGTVGDLLD